LNMMGFLVPFCAFDAVRLVRFFDQVHIVWSAICFVFWFLPSLPTWERQNANHTFHSVPLYPMGYGMAKSRMDLLL
jgi:hypothetical protein